MANQNGVVGQKSVRKNQTKGRNGKRKLLILAIEIIVLLLAVAWIWINGKMDKLNTDVNFHERDVTNLELPEETKEVLVEYTTIALFGLDNREDSSYNSGNSDVIMVARIDNDSKEVRLVSVYRDTFLKMADLKNTDAYSKANAAYAVGGPQQAVRMLNTNLDLDIREYISFDFSAVAEAVDILGGVEVDITEEEAGHLNNYCVETSKITGKSYSPLPGAGTYTLNGVQAVSYGRIRYTAGDDFKRTERQRLVLNKMVEKALESDMLTINKLIDTVFPKIQTSLTKVEVVNLAKDAFNYKLGETAGFPFDRKNEVVSISYQRGDSDCVIPADLASNVKQLHDFLYGTSSYQVTDSVQSISDEIVYRTNVKAQDKE